MTDYFKWSGVRTVIYDPPEDLKKVYVPDQFFPCLHWGSSGIDFVVTMPNYPENLCEETEVIHAGVNFDVLIERFLQVERATTDIDSMKDRRKAACLALGNALSKLTNEPFRCKPTIRFIA